MAKIALVTGAASGIGKATATALAQKGYHTVVLVRNAKRGEETTRDILAKAPGAKVEVLVADLGSQASIRAAASEFLSKHDKLDVLVNAAGVFVKEKKVTPDGLEQTFAVNYMAYFTLTNLLLDALKRAAPSRIVNVSSKYGGAKVDLDDPNFEKRPYSYLKSTPPTMAARVAFTLELAERLKGSGVVVNSLHPGLVANTQLLHDTGGFFRWLTNTIGGTPEKGADTAVWLATAPETADVSGKMFEKRKEIKTPGQPADADARRKLWQMSERFAKLP
ncbi:MAG TPA: SDR family oxidoreductase [Candidatus Thermoplasmatota archaeon]|nr:SDR family oxidoreductase [Candidatus Thermoplasmatota archaeon]